MPIIIMTRFGGVTPDAKYCASIAHDVNRNRANYTEFRGQVSICVIVRDLMLSGI